MMLESIVYGVIIVVFALVLAGLTGTMMDYYNRTGISDSTFRWMWWIVFGLLIVWVFVFHDSAQREVVRRIGSGRSEVVPTSLAPDGTPKAWKLQDAQPEGE